LAVLLVLACLSILAAHPQKRGVVAEDSSDQSTIVNGKYYALVIGINQYHGKLPRLTTAVNDAQAMAKILHDRYGFQVTTLIDTQATRANIIGAIRNYRNTLDKNDSLLIYYGGHGSRDRDADKAYWLPVDADSADSANSIIADELTSEMKALPSRHVLIISDSCYSGGLSRGGEPEPDTKAPGYVIRQLGSKSRDMMSSGGDDPVSDNGPDGHSVFANAILKGLEHENDSMFGAWDLFSSVRKQVADNSEQIPQYEAIHNSGDDGGDFIFARGGTAKITGASTLASGATRGAAQPAAVAEPEPAASPASAGGSPSAVGSAGGASGAFDRGLALLKSGQYTEAFSQLTIACDGGIARGCGNLGTMYQNGKGVSPDLVRAAALYRKACDGDGWGACYFLGGMYNEGTGVSKDQAQAAAFFRRACEEGSDSRGCNSLGIAYGNGVGVAQNSAQAAAMFKKACDLGFQTGCQNLTVQNSRTNAVAQNQVQAAAPQTAPPIAAPTAPSAPGSTMDPVDAFNRGLALGKNGQYAQGIAFFRIACNGGHALACSYLGLAYHSGTGVPADQGQAAAYSLKGCLGGAAMGCNNLGVGYEYGYGLPRNLPKALELYRQACNAGYDMGCQNLRRLQR
jgi:TPR repeat protein